MVLASPLWRLAFAGAFLVFTASAFTATLRVPEEYTSLQRAIIAADDGDTIVVGPGVFPENLTIYKPLTLQGAGREKTVLLGRDRTAPVINAGPLGPITLSDLTARHDAPASPIDPDDESYFPSNGLNLWVAPIALRSISVENAAADGIQFDRNLVTADSLFVSNATTTGVVFSATKADSVVAGLTVGPGKGENSIIVVASSVMLRDLKADWSLPAAVVITGAESAVTFENLSATLRGKIVWQDGASPTGPKATPSAPAETPADPDVEPDPFAPDPERMAEENARWAAAEAHQIASEPARRELARALQRSLNETTTAEEHAAAVAGYFEKLYATRAPGSTEDARVGLAVAAELRAFLERFGPIALKAASAKWPPAQEDPDAPNYYTALYTRDMVAALEKSETQMWAAAEEAAVTATLVSWKSSASTDTEASAAAFLSMLKTLSEKTTTAPENVKSAVRDRALAELPSLIETGGYGSLNRLIRALNATPTALIKASDIQNSLSTDQKRALIQHIRSGK